MKQSVLVHQVSARDLDNAWTYCNELAPTMGYASFFCSGDWLRAAAANLMPGESPLVLAVTAGDRIKAILPLETRANAVGGKDLHFLGSGFYPDPVGVICSPSDRGISVAAIREYVVTIPGWDRLILNWILEDELAAWERSGRPCSVEPFRRLPHEFDVLLNEFKAKKRYNLRASVRKLKEAGAEMVVAVGRDNNEQFLGALFALHQKRASERTLSSSLEGHRVRAFHDMLVASTTMARFYGLVLNQELIAVIYGFEFCNRFFYYQVAHDPAHGDLSPGAALLFLVIQDCCKRGLTEFNFLQGNEDYKGVWADDSRVLYRGMIERGTIRSRLLHTIEHAKRIARTAADRIGRGT